MSTEFHYTVNKWDGNPAAGRQKFIGGSDAGTVLGLNPYKSPYQLWAEKTGLVETEDISNKLSVWFGTEEEEIVAKRFCLETGFKVRRSFMSYGIEEYPFLTGHIDRLIVGQDAGLECKTTGSWNKTNYMDGEIPPMHYAQVQFYMLVTGRKEWYYAVKRDNNQFFHCLVPRDDDYINAMLPVLSDFWKHVESKEPVDIDGSKATADTLQNIYPGNKEDDEVVHLDSELDELLNQRKLLKESESEIKSSVSEIENKIKDAIGDAQKGESTHYYVKWSIVKPRELLDGERLRNDHPGIYKQYLKETAGSRKFTVKERKA